MVHHEPWGTSQFTCSLLAIYRSCSLHFHKYTRYPAFKILSAVSHRVSLCSVLVTTIMCLPLRQKWNRIWRLSEKKPFSSKCATKCVSSSQSQDEPWGRKLCRLKRRGPQRPGTAYISPHCGLKAHRYRGRIWRNGVLIGVVPCGRRIYQRLHRGHCWPLCKLKGPISGQYQMLKWHTN